jgi:hypothetical protein
MILISSFLAVSATVVIAWLLLLVDIGVNGFARYTLAHSAGPRGSRVLFIRGVTHRLAAQEAAMDTVSAEDAVILIKPKAMERLLELKEKQPNSKDTLILRMGVRNGGCSGTLHIGLLSFLLNNTIFSECVHVHLLFRAFQTNI